MKQVFIAILISFLSILPCTFSPDAVCEEEWMGIYSDGDKIGYSRTLIKTTGDSIEVAEETRFRMTVLGSDQDINVKSSYVVKGYEIQSFDFFMNAPPIELKAEGKREGDVLKITMSSVSGPAETVFPLGKEPLIPALLFKWLSNQKPKVGNRYEVLLFDPTTILTGASPESMKTEITIEAEEEIKIPLGAFKTYRIKMIFSGSEIMAWMTENGRLIKEISPPGLTSIRETEEEALGKALASLDIVQKTAVSSNVQIKNARDLKLLRVRVSGVESLDGLDLSDDYRQSFKDGLIEVRSGDLSQVTAYSIPYSSPEHELYVKPVGLIQSDDTKIVEKSREILKGETDSLKAAMRINDWVYENVEKFPTVSLPSALDVLKTKRGDCNEHAALFAALSRAAGIPAKVALGVVFLDGKFYYHAWNEVYVGSWVAVDPTFGQFPADASHVKLIEGDFTRSGEILRVVGKIKLEIIEAS